jgi:hypothetical protein
LRRVVIEGNEIYGATKEGISVMSQVPFSAHNLKVEILQNKVSKCRSDGILVSDLAISNLIVANNESF